MLSIVVDMWRTSTTRTISVIKVGIWFRIVFSFRFGFGFAHESGKCVVNKLDIRYVNGNATKIHHIMSQSMLNICGCF